jgi:HEPN domain-containing protein
MVNVWFKKAIEDYRSAQALYELNGEGHLLNSAFLAQQSIEKSLKGFLTFHNTRFEKTHHLSELLGLGTPTGDVPNYFNEQKILIADISDFAVACRYPDAAGDMKKLNREHIKLCLEFTLKCFLDLSKLSQIHE